MKSSLVSGVIAFGIIMAICYVAGSVIEVILVSILLAIILDPGVDLLRRIHTPRALASFLMVTLMMGVLYLAFQFLYNRVEDFAAELPRYSRVVRAGVLRIRSSAEQLQRQTEQVIPPSQERVQRVMVSEPSLLAHYLFPGFEAVSNAFLLISLIPFLVFFLLSWKERLYRSFMDAFGEGDREGAAGSLHSIASMVRGYLVGNVLVGLILSVLSAVLFVALDLRFPLILGLLSGFLSLIPYVGALLAVAGPVLIALDQFQTATPYLILTGSLIGFHVIGLNFLLPKVVGGKVNLNPVVVTLAILIWGWMWGAMGLILAIPITAGAKAVCDNVPEWNKFGRLLGE